LTLSVTIRKSSKLGKHFFTNVSRSIIVLSRLLYVSACDACFIFIQVCSCSQPSIHILSFPNSSVAPAIICCNCS
jgi:hypothetical protein